MRPPFCRDVRLSQSHVPAEWWLHRQKLIPSRTRTHWCTRTRSNLNVFYLLPPFFLNSQCTNFHWRLQACPVFRFCNMDILARKSGENMLPDQTALKLEWTGVGATGGFGVTQTCAHQFPPPARSANIQMIKIQTPYSPLCVSFSRHGSDSLHA